VKVDYIDKTDSKFGLSSLGWAASNGEVEAVRVLLDRRANVEPQGTRQKSPLLCAVSNGHIEVVKLLLNRGANVEVQNTHETGLSALRTAIWRRDEEMVKLLVKMGANVDALGPDGCSPLHWAALKRDKEMLKLLVKIGANLDMETTDGYSALHSAISSSGTWRIWHVAGTPLVPADPFDKTARSKEFLEIAKYLLDEGASLEKPSTKNAFPIHAAVRTGHVEMVKLLLDYGASIETLDKDGRSALGCAALEGCSEYSDWREKVNLLVDRGAKFEAANMVSPLYLAAIEGHVEMVHLLLAKGATVDAESHGWSPLVAAASRGHLDAAKVLLANGAKVDAYSTTHWSPLLAAASHGCVEMVKFLLNVGANAEGVREKFGTSLQDYVRSVHAKERDSDNRKRLLEIVSILE
jgi:ankyrin repeat protein